MTCQDILELLAAAVRDASGPTPDFARLRAVASLARAALQAIELTDLEMRLQELEARFPPPPKTT